MRVQYFAVIIFWTSSLLGFGKRNGGVYYRSHNIQSPLYKNKKSQRELQFMAPPMIYWIQGLIHHWEGGGSIFRSDVLNLGSIFHGRGSKYYSIPVLKRATSVTKFITKRVLQQWTDKKLKDLNEITFPTPLSQQVHKKMQNHFWLILFITF